MGKVVVTEFITLDGVVEDPGGAEDFEYAGWSFEFNRGEEGDQFKDEELKAAEFSCWVASLMKDLQRRGPH